MDIKSSYCCLLLNLPQGTGSSCSGLNMLPPQQHGKENP
jgi:hypothetical protein